MLKAFILIYRLYVYNIIDIEAIISLAVLPIALYYSYHVMRNYNTRDLASANWGTIGIHSLTGILLIIGVEYI